MIFVTVGTHPQEFTRLAKAVDKLAPVIGEEIILQRGYTKYIPKNCKSFDFAPSLEPYFKKARLIISHGASTVWEFVYSHKKPIIIVPRQCEYKEHINNHQVEFARMFERKTGVKVIYDISNLTPELLASYKKIVRIDDKNLKRLQDFLKNLISKFEK